VGVAGEVYRDYRSPWLETSLPCKHYDYTHPFQLFLNAKALFASPSDWNKQGYTHGAAFTAQSLSNDFLSAMILSREAGQMLLDLFCEINLGLQIHL